MYKNTLSHTTWEWKYHIQIISQKRLNFFLLENLGLLKTILLIIFIFIR